MNALIRCYVVGKVPFTVKIRTYFQHVRIGFEHESHTIRALCAGKRREWLVAKIYSYTVALESDLLDAYCVLQKGFTDQFVYYRKDAPVRYMGLGRCIALSSIRDTDFVTQTTSEETGGQLADLPCVMFSFNRFDADNPKPADEMMRAFPRLRFLVPEIVLLENEHGSYLQVNSLGPVYQGRVDRFLRHAAEAPRRKRRSIDYRVIPDSYAAWEHEMGAALDHIASGRVKKLVPSRREAVMADAPFSSKDVLLNLIDGSGQGTVFLYRYGDVFFCGCTPELLVRKQGCVVESMCLAGTASIGEDAEERAALADFLMNDEKNRTEHDHVVRFIREVFDRNCYDVEIPREPSILALKHVQHLHTPARARVMDGVSLYSLMEQLHPTPALAGQPVGEALMALREIEDHNRGFYGGAIGVVDALDNGEFSVAIRSGVFDGEAGWIYAGCGIVEGSDTRAEFDEIDMKFQTILSAFQGE